MTIKLVILNDDVPNQEKRLVRVTRTGSAEHVPPVDLRPGESATVYVYGGAGVQVEEIPVCPPGAIQ